MSNTSLIHFLLSIFCLRKNHKENEFQKEKEKAHKYHSNFSVVTPSTIRLRSFFLKNILFSYKF